jgi:hypothetical protein
MGIISHTVAGCFLPPPKGLTERFTTARFIERSATDCRGRIRSQMRLPTRARQDPPVVTIAGVTGGTLLSVM